ncbi:MAG: ATPase, T2SS/T4P/T4SS family [bacterium]|nr:ATPase, T2SS/T4P/T4SS family [bacterium]
MEILEKLFTENTTSIHIKSNNNVLAKVGTPGNWQLITLDYKFSKEELTNIINDILKNSESLIEISRENTKVIQLNRYRIVVVLPPVSEEIEITIAKPIRKLTLEDYLRESNVSDLLRKRIEKQAEGLLIAGAPGQGKTTFAQAITEHYASLKKIVKTLESPRDLQVSSIVTQYSKTHANINEIYDILLLSRPDYVIFDEMRNNEDFNLYVDLRLAGVGMVGVIHATSPFAAIQRFIHRIELGVIPSIIDTVIFINKGKIEKVLMLSISVKVPEGMLDPGLARPVVEVRNFEDGTLEYEIYTFGEQTIIVPVKKISQELLDELNTKVYENVKLILGNKKFKVETLNPKYAIIWVNEKNRKDIIGKKGKIIKDLENILNMKLEVKTFDY